MLRYHRIKACSQIKRLHLVRKVEFNSTQCHRYTIRRLQHWPVKLLFHRPI